MKFRRQLLPLTLLWLLATASLALAQDWFSNNDSIKDLTRMAPADSEFFLGLDLTDLFTESRIKKLKEKAASSDFNVSKSFLHGMETGIGYRLEELPSVLGPRAFVAVTGLGPGMPNIVLGFEIQDQKAAVNLFRSLGAIPRSSSLKPVTIGNTEFWANSKAGYGIYGDYLLVTNSMSSLQASLGEGESLAKVSAAEGAVESVMVDRGVVAFVKIPADFDRDLKDFSEVFAGLGFRGNDFLSNLLVMFREDSTLAPALLSGGGRLTGDAARFIPREWGFMASVHLGYLQEFRQKLKEHDPKISGRFEDEAQEIEKMLGITLDELMDVSTGEVVVSSNGFRMAPKLYLGISDGHDGSLPYELTVNIGLTDSHGANLLLKRAWERLSLKSEKDYDGVIFVPRIGLAYVMQNDQLIMSYGKKSVSTLRRCLALKPGQSLAFSSGLQQQHPTDPCIASAYMDLRTVVQELGGIMDLTPYEAILRHEELLEGTFVLRSTKQGLRLSGSGAAPFMLGFAGGGMFFLSNDVGEKAYSKPE